MHDSCSQGFLCHRSASSGLSSHDLSVQFNNKIQASRQRRDSGLIKAKLEEQSVTLNKLHFSEDDDLVGRDQELQQLRSAFDQFISSSYSPADASYVISISGTSGTGKTVLAKQLKRDALQAEGYFCLGKFDMNNNQQAGGGAQPYTAFAAASNELAKQIMQRKEAFEADIIRDRIEIAIGDEGIRLLLQVFPGLSGFLKASSTTDIDANGRLASLEQKTNQLHYTIRQLFRILSSKDSPFVLVLDDVQWADTPSLNLIEALLADRETCFMLIATYRSNEMSNDHPFLGKLQALQAPEKVQQGIHIRVINIPVYSLSEAASGSLIANVLRETEENTKTLARTLFQKTNGNAFFLVQYLHMLVNDDLLTYNLGLMKWTWKDEDIQALSVSENVGDLLSRRIKQLDGSSTQKLLEVAACLGQTFEGQTLMVALMALEKSKILEASVTEDAGKYLDECVDAGLLKCTGSGDDIDSRYTFVHDTIQATAHEMIPKEELPKMQLEIGRSLLRHRSYRVDIVDCDDASEDVFFLAVDLCNKGSDLLDSEGKVRLAVENCRASNDAIEKFAFEAAISYGKSGIKYLADCPDDLISDNRQIKYIRLELHVALAEAFFCIGDNVASEEYAELIIGSDFSFDEKFNGYVTRMSSQFAQRKMTEATETTLFILRELGCCKNLGVNPGPLRIMHEIIKTKQLWKSYSKEDLIGLSLMTNKNRLRAVTTIFRSNTALHSANANLFIVLLLITLRWTIKYGVSNFSPPIFAIYGLIECGVLGDFDRGTMIGEVALALSERLQATQTVAATTGIVYSFIFHWTKHIRNARSALEFASATGLQAGDVNYAMSTMMMLDHNSYMCGFQHLQELSDKFRENVAKIRAMGNDTFLVEHSIAWQFVLNLRGKAADPLVLTGEALDQQETIEKAKATNHQRAVIAINIWLGILGYLHDNHEFAVSRMSQVEYKTCLSYVMMPRMFSFLALSHVALAQEGKQPRKNIRRANNIKNKMLKKWVAPGNINIAHLVKLLDAELTSIRNPDAAASMYEEVIRLATRAGFRNDTGTIHARAARFFFDVLKDVSSGSYHLEKAVYAYWEWGAIGVAKSLLQKYMDPAVRESHGWYGDIQMSDRMQGTLSERSNTTTQTFPIAILDESTLFSVD